MIIGNIYGLANAPAIWCDEVRRRLCSVGFVSSTLDVMFFLCRNSVGCLIAAIIVHVDDFFVIYNQYEFDIFIVKNLLFVGIHSRMEQRSWLRQRCIPGEAADGFHATG
jgi:hypothetical protein